MRLLNIGSGPPTVPMPPHYDGWDVVRLDMEASFEPDLCMDALDVGTLPWGSYDAAYCCHFLEHLYPADLDRFLLGVYRVIGPDGWFEVRVPDALAACKAAAFHDDLDAPCYDSPGGLIRAWDILYGYLPYQMREGKVMAHHNAFSQRSLTDTLRLYGFGLVYVSRAHFQLCAVGCKSDLPPEMKERLSIERATGEHRPVHPDAGAADLGVVRQFRAVAELPLRDAPRPPGDGHPPAEAAAGGRGAQLPGAASVGGRL